MQDFYWTFHKQKDYAEISASFDFILDIKWQSNTSYVFFVYRSRQKCPLKLYSKKYHHGLHRPNNVQMIRPSRQADGFVNA